MAKIRSYPENLLYELDVNQITDSLIDYKELTEDQQNGLDYILKNFLTEREHIVFRHYYQENMSCKAISERYNLVENRIRQIINHAVRKIKRNPEWIFYIANGYEAQTEYIQDQLRSEEKKYLESRGIVNEAHIYYQEVSELGFPTRVFNPLTKAGIVTIRDLILYVASSNRIRHLGELSCALICDKLTAEGLLPQNIVKDCRYDPLYNIPRIDEELRAFRKINAYCQ